LKIEHKSITIPNSTDRCENISKIEFTLLADPTWVRPDSLLFPLSKWLGNFAPFERMGLFRVVSCLVKILTLTQLLRNPCFSQSYFSLSVSGTQWLHWEDGDFCVVPSHLSGGIWTLLREAAVRDYGSPSCHGSHHQESGKVQDDKLKVICHCQLHGIKGKTNCICFGKW